MRGATKDINYRTGREDISIHAPHAGRDLVILEQWFLSHYFNPRAPCGARRSTYESFFP